MLRCMLGNARRVAPWCPPPARALSSVTAPPALPAAPTRSAAPRPDRPRGRGADKLFLAYKLSGELATATDPEADKQRPLLLARLSVMGLPFGKYSITPTASTSSSSSSGSSSGSTDSSSGAGGPTVIAPLDYGSEGLVLVAAAGQGRLAQYLSGPGLKGLRRTYRVRVQGRLSPHAVRQLARGVVVDGRQCGSIVVVPANDRDERERERAQQREQQQQAATTGGDASAGHRRDAVADGAGPGGKGSNQWLVVNTFDNKVRDLRAALSHFGLRVSRVQRTEIGPWRLGRLPRGAAVAVPVPRALQEAADKHAGGSSSGSSGAADGRQGIRKRSSSSTSTTTAQQQEQQQQQAENTSSG